MRGEFNEFFIVKQIKKLICALFCCKVIRKRLEHTRRRKKHAVSPQTSFVLQPLPACFTTEQSTGKVFLFVNYEKVKKTFTHPPTTTLSDFVVIVMISGVSEVSHYNIGYMYKERRYTSKLMYSS